MDLKKLVQIEMHLQADSDSRATIWRRVRHSGLRQPLKPENLGHVEDLAATPNVCWDRSSLILFL